MSTKTKKAIMSGVKFAAWVAVAAIVDKGLVLIPSLPVPELWAAVIAMLGKSAMTWIATQETTAQSDFTAAVK